jgi:hypothetical protein
MSWQVRARVDVANKVLATKLLARSRMYPRWIASLGSQREIFLDVPDNDADNDRAAWLAAKTELENRLGSQLADRPPEPLEVMKVEECWGQ